MWPNITETIRDFVQDEGIEINFTKTFRNINSCLPFQSQWIIKRIEKNFFDLTVLVKKTKKKKTRLGCKM